MSDDQRMTKAEAASLRRLVRDRFRLLRAQLPARQAEILYEVRVEIDQETQDLVDAANAEGNELAEEIAALTAKRDEFMARMVAQGLTPGYGDALRSWRSVTGEKSFRRRREALLAQRAQVDLRLQEQELGLIELLAMRDLHSGEAMDFLGQIPSVEAALTAPPPQAIEAGDDDEEISF